MRSVFMDAAQVCVSVIAPGVPVIPGSGVCRCATGAAGFYPQFARVAAQVWID